MQHACDRFHSFPLRVMVGRRGRGIRMGRGRRGVFDDLITLPWPVALVVGGIGYAGIWHGVPAVFARQDGPFAHALSNASASLAPLASGMPRHAMSVVCGHRCFLSPPTRQNPPCAF